MNDLRKYMDLINSIENDTDVPDMETGNPSSAYIFEKSNLLVETLCNDLSKIFEGDFKAFNNSIDYKLPNAKSIDESKGINKYSLFNSITESLAGFIKLKDSHFENDDLVGTVIMNEVTIASRGYSTIEAESLYEKVKSEQWQSRLKQMGFGNFTKENFVNVLEDFKLKNIPDNTLHRLKENSILDLIVNNHLTVDNLAGINYPIIFECDSESWMFNGALTENVMSLLGQNNQGIVIRWNGERNVIVSR